MKSKIMPPEGWEALSSPGGVCALLEAVGGNVNNWFPYRFPGASSTTSRRTLLHVCAWSASLGEGGLSALQECLRLGADVNAQSPDDGSTALHIAAHAKGEFLTEALRVLIEHGADKELRDNLGRRPVDILMAQVRRTRDRVAPIFSPLPAPTATP